MITGRVLRLITTFLAISVFVPLLGTASASQIRQPIDVWPPDVPGFTTINGFDFAPSGDVYLTDISAENIVKLNTSWGLKSDWSTATSTASYIRGVAVDSTGIIYVADSYASKITAYNSSGGVVRTISGTGWAYDIAVDSSNILYILDWHSGKVVRFNSAGTRLGEWGSRGSGDGQFKWPEGIAIGPGDTVYVADTQNSRVQKLDKNGNFQAKWSGVGSAKSIAVDSNSNVYVGKGSGQVGKYDSSGSSLSTITFASGTSLRPNYLQVDSSNNLYIVYDGLVDVYNSAGIKTATHRSAGGPSSLFDTPLGIDVDPTGNVFVSDNGHRVQKFDSSGTLLTSWGSEGTGDGQFNSIGKIAVNENGIVYVFDKGNFRIQKFSNNGTFLSAWGSEGTANGQFYWSQGGLGLDANGKVFGSDVKNVSGRIQRFSPGGTYHRSWNVWGIPSDVAVDSGGQVLSVDRSCGSSDSCIRVFSPAGLHLTSFGHYAFFGPEILDMVTGADIDREGNIDDTDSLLVTEQTQSSSGTQHRVVRFDSDNRFIEEWGAKGHEYGYFDMPGDVAVAPDGSIYVVDIGNHRVQKFAPYDNVWAWNYIPSLTYSSWTRVHGLLKKDSGAAWPNTFVYLQVWDYGLKKWVWKATDKTSSSGYYDFWFKPYATTHYRVATAGSAQVSNRVTKTVHKRVIFSLNDYNFNLGASSIASVEVQPRHPGSPVYLQEWDTATQKWVWVTTITLNSLSKGSYTWTPSSAGWHALRTHAPRHWDHEENYSSVHWVKVQ